jgi:anti-sigma-K factor RskA
MSSVEDSGPEGGGDDIVAAEYVLGVLSAEERAAAARRIDSDAAFARLVDQWEVWFAPLGLTYQPVEAPASVKAAVDRRLFGAGTAPQGASTQGAPAARLWSSLAFWRTLAAAALALLAIYIAVPYISPPAEAPRLVASLSAEGSDVRYLAVYDAALSEVALSHVSGERGAGRDFELWMIEGANAPVSMGVIPAGESVHLPVAPATKAKLEQGAVLAVSLEPAGGSPTGQPTGPVVAAGDLRSI